MTTVSITKIQLRRGPAADLPGAASSPGLDEGELGYTTDTGRLFVGVGNDSPVQGMPNFQRAVFPYQNIEVLTENTPLGAMFGTSFSDNQIAFLQSSSMPPTPTFVTMQINDPRSNTPIDFHLDGPFGCNVNLYYFMVDGDGAPIRQGVLNILWNSSFVTAPLCTDTAQSLVSNYTNFQFQAVQLGVVGRQYIALQYTNLSTVTPTIFFRLDRPSEVFETGGGAANLLSLGGVSLGLDGYLPWSIMKPEIQNAPLGFIVAGKPIAVPTPAVFNLIMTEALTIPANLAGTMVYCSTIAAAPAAFTLNKISGGVTTGAATITIHAASHTVVTLSTQAAFTMAIGDVLQLVAPGTQDATLADIGITILAQKI